MQNVDLRNKNNKQLFVKNESGAARKKIIFDFFFQLNFFSIFSFKFLNILCPDHIHKSHILQEKIVKFEPSHPKKVLDECSQLWNFFL